MCNRTRVKICGLRTESEVEAAITAGADAVGFVFARSSPRYLDPDRAAELACLLPPFVDAVGLFVNAPAEEILGQAERACIDTIQLHGDEPEELVREVTAEFTIINAVQFSEANVRRWASNPDVDLLLVDGSAGGEGQRFDWTRLAALRDGINLPIMLAGGLTADNVGEAIRVVKPYAVDVSSGVERERGVKDIGMIQAFCDAVRIADSPSSD